VRCGVHVLQNLAQGRPGYKGLRLVGGELFFSALCAALPLICYLLPVPCTCTVKGACLKGGVRYDE